MATDVHPEPDSKDWTWVLDRRCDECGLDVSTLSVAEVADALEFAAAEWLQVLTANPAAARRPAPQVWSPLEYGAHVRDVFLRFGQRLQLMLDHDDPEFPDWDQDRTAVQDDYASQDPDVVAEQLVDTATGLVATLRGLGADQRQRTGRRDNGSTFTTTTLSRYKLHDVVHHLWDVTGMRAAVPPAAAGR